VAINPRSGLSAGAGSVGNGDINVATDKALTFRGADGEPSAREVILPIRLNTICRRSPIWP
jgi:hypothetical protein